MFVPRQVLYADTVELTSGKVIKGKIVASDEKSVQILSDGRSYDIPFKLMEESSRVVVQEALQRNREAQDVDPKAQLDAMLSAGLAGDFDQLREQLKAIEPDDPVFFLNQVLNDYEQGVVSKDFVHWYFTGEQLLERAEYEEGLAALLKAEQAYDQYPELLAEIGTVYYRLDDMERAVSYNQKALALNGEYLLALGNLGALYRKVGQTENAVAAFTQILEITPDAYRIYEALGNTYVDSGNTQDGVKVLLTAYKLAPEDYGVNMSLGTAYVMSGKERLGLPYLKNAVAFNPKSFAANIAAGMASATLELYSDAVIYLEAASFEQPSNFVPYFELGNLYLNTLNDMDSALYYFEKAHDVKPEDPVINDLIEYINSLKS